MLKFFHLLLTFILVFSAALKADEATSPVSEAVSNAEKDATKKNAKPAKEPVAEIAPEEGVEIPESELFEMVGFLTAQGGGVSMLELNDTEIEALAAGLVDGLSGTKSLRTFRRNLYRKHLVGHRHVPKQLRQVLKKFPKSVKILCIRLAS